MEFLLQVANALNCTEVLTSSIFPYDEETPSVLVFWVDIHYDVLDVLGFFLSFIVVLQ